MPEKTTGRDGCHRATRTEHYVYANRSTYLGGSVAPHRALAGPASGRWALGGRYVRVPTPCRPWRPRE